MPKSKEPESVSRWGEASDKEVEAQLAKSAHADQVRAAIEKSQGLAPRRQTLVENQILPLN